MKTTPIVLALALATVAFAAAPTASAAPCVVGDESCLAHAQVIVCVTEPCDWLVVCAGWGAVCVRA